MFVNQVDKAENNIFDEISKEICGSSNHITYLPGKPIFRYQVKCYEGKAWNVVRDSVSYLE